MSDTVVLKNVYWKHVLPGDVCHYQLFFYQSPSKSSEWMTIVSVDTLEGSCCSIKVLCRLGLIQFSRNPNEGVRILVRKI